MKQIAVLLMALLLAACSSPTVDDLVNDPKLLSRLMDKCEQRLVSGKSTDTTECQNAITATKQIILKGTEDSIKLVRKNSKLIVDDLHKKAPKALEDFEKSTQKALEETRANAEEIFEKAKKLLDEN